MPIRMVSNAKRVNISGDPVFSVSVNRSNKVDKKWAGGGDNYWSYLGEVRISAFQMVLL